MTFTADTFKSHKCPPLGNNPRTYERLAEFVNLQFKPTLDRLKDAEATLRVVANNLSPSAIKYFERYHWRDEK